MDALLWSINERMAGREGLDLDPLGTEWLDDLMDIAAVEAEEWDNRQRGIDEDDFEE